MLSDKQIESVRNSWNLISSVSKEVGEEFYTHLFETHPEIRPMFKSDPRDQAMKFMFMISYIVHRLDNPDELKEEIVKLANRHQAYGAKEKHFAIIGENLLWSLKNRLGKEWTKETESAWSATYQYISGLMLSSQKF